MTARPIRYGPTQYPMKYRPLGYGIDPDAVAAADAAPPPGPPRRRRRWIVLAIALATLTAHGAIAATYAGGDEPVQSIATEPDVEPGESCDAGEESGEPVPDPDAPQQEGDSGGGSTDQSDSLRRRL
jgi:hypothetical protein